MAYVRAFILAGTAFATLAAAPPSTSIDQRISAHLEQSILTATSAEQIKRRCDATLDIGAAA
ncbi:MAG TPA: hypothetical protein VNJ05_07635, partial [Sphingomicrobium sp.]|nr:hypothetical protein [Sphingomicrobium sp.]